MNLKERWKWASMALLFLLSAAFVFFPSILDWGFRLRAVLVINLIVATGVLVHNKDNLRKNR